MPKEYLNPKELFPSLQYGFSQIVVTYGGGKTVYLSGQVAWDGQQQIVGGDDLGAQTGQTLRNIDIAMQAAGGTLADVVSMRIYVVKEKLAETHHVSTALREFFPAEQAPATTWIGVYALANPDFLIESEAIGSIEPGEPRP
jgi:enamine deaminase RidA (YjgF/YER057c/UK114 family)